MAKDKNKQNQGGGKAQNGVTTQAHISAREEGRNRTKLEEFGDIIIDLLGGVAAAGTILLGKYAVETVRERRAAKKAALEAGNESCEALESAPVEVEADVEDEWSFPDGQGEADVVKYIGYAIEDLDCTGPEDFKAVREMMVEKNDWVDGMPNLNGLISRELKALKKMAPAPAADDKS